MKKHLLPLTAALCTLLPLGTLTLTTHASAGTCGVEVECASIPDLQPSAPDDGWNTLRSRSGGSYHYEP